MERDELVSIRWELWEVSVLLLAFVIAQFAYYACLPYLLKMASATALNLSLLATDYYTVVAGMVFFNYKVLLKSMLGLHHVYCITNMAIPVMEFSREGCKIRKVFG